MFKCVFDNLSSEMNTCIIDFICLYSMSIVVLFSKMNATFCIRKGRSSLVAHDLFSEMNAPSCTRNSCSSLVAHELFSEMNTPFIPGRAVQV